MPASPKTTYGVGVVRGGTSVNSIPAEVSMDVDLRSESCAELKKIDDAFLAVVREAVAEENRTRSTREGRIEADPKVIGERPCGETPADAPIVQSAAAAIRAFGLTPAFTISSTDANVPMSLGIPADHDRPRRTGRPVALTRRMGRRRSRRQRQERPGRAGHPAHRRRRQVIRSIVHPVEALNEALAVDVRGVRRLFRGRPRRCHDRADHDHGGGRGRDGRPEHRAEDDDPHQGPEVADRHRGAAPARVSTIADLVAKQIIILQHDQKTAQMVGAPAAGTASSTTAAAVTATVKLDASVTPTGKSQVIDGFKCDEFTFTTTMNMCGDRRRRHAAGSRRR